jgi:hypothetical protein
MRPYEPTIAVLRNPAGAAMGVVTLTLGARDGFLLGRFQAAVATAFHCARA